MIGAPFREVEFTEMAPDWYRGRSAYAVAVTGTKLDPGTTGLGRFEPEELDAPMSLLDRARFAGRFVAGSAVGFVFVPIGAALALRERLARARRS